MSLGVWFTEHATAVIPSYITSEPTPVSMDDHHGFDDTDKWLQMADKIDFCVVTVSNYDNDPGMSKGDRTYELIRNFQNHGIEVYIAVSSLLFGGGGSWKEMENKDQAKTAYWISPTDTNRADGLSQEINRYCELLNPTGVLLWYATYPSEKYGYECTECVMDNGIMDMECRAEVVTEFLTEVATNIKNAHDVNVAIETDVDGSTDIKYNHGINLTQLDGVIDEIIYHVHKSDNKTITRALQLAAKAERNNITPRYYISIENVSDFKSVYEKIKRGYSTDFLIFTTTQSVAQDVIKFFLRKKWIPIIQRVSLAGSILAFTLGLGEFYIGFGFPILSDYLPAPSIILSGILLIISLNTEEFLFTLERLEKVVFRQTSIFTSR
jgi:ribosomal protein S8